MLDAETTPDIANTLISLLTGGAVGSVGALIVKWLRERRSLQVALQAEIDRTCDAIRDHLAFIRGQSGSTIQPHAVDVTWLPFRTPVWDGLVGKLGALAPDRAREVAKFFGFFGFINEFQALRAEYKRLNRESEFGKMYIKLLEDQLKRTPTP